MEFFHTPTQYLKSSAQKGFTLVELVVVVAIIAVLFVSVVVLFNPAAQIAKSQNATRQHDLEEIRTALDTYFNDNGCYPSTITFGTAWTVGSSVYITKVPDDPICQQSGNHCYIYETDTSSSCPQWNVLYAALASPVPTSTSCPLLHIDSSCKPANYDSLGLNYCVISGKPDCSIIEADQITPVPPAGSGNGGNGGNGGGGSGGGSSPTPTPEICPGGYYACTGVKTQQNSGCNTLGSDPQNQCTVHNGSYPCYCTPDCENRC